MPGKRTDVETIREILRLSYELKLSIKKIAEALEISKTSVGEYLAEFIRINQGLTGVFIWLQVGSYYCLTFTWSFKKAFHILNLPIPVFNIFFISLPAHKKSNVLFCFYSIRID